MKRVVLAAALAAATAPALAGEVDVEVRNLRAATGHLRVAICREPEFLQPICTFRQAVPAVKGTMTVRFADVPPGTYAAQAYLDEHDWGEIRRDALGFPDQGIGFSNDAPMRFGPPSFADARFTVGAVPVQVRITLTYYSL
ncbi:MAG TPA: DUF2141 domain-containing protein [Acidisphaera sp.]|nr:DUF2141 domain-containing protein [Acidisphaera sp.]